MLCRQGLERLLQPLLVHNAVKLSCCCPNRQYWHPSTHVFERKHPIGLVGKGKFPLLKRRHYVYDKIKPLSENYSKTMQCVLTKEILGIGFEGQIVDVTKKQFRNELYPGGLAVYASPENIAKYEEVRKSSRDYGIDYASKMTLLKLSHYHIDVFMNTDTEWVLNENHIRIALRKMGILVDNENIILDESFTAAGPITFWIQVQSILCTSMTGTIHSLDEVVDKRTVEETDDPEELKKRVLFCEDVFGTERFSGNAAEDI